jgi:hypothetical protein
MAENKLNKAFHGFNVAKSRLRLDVLQRINYYLAGKVIVAVRQWDSSVKVHDIVIQASRVNIPMKEIISTIHHRVKALESLGGSVYRRIKSLTMEMKSFHPDIDFLANGCLWPSGGWSALMLPHHFHWLLVHQRRDEGREPRIARRPGGRAGADQTTD